MGGVRVDHAVVSGTFSLDGEVHEVDNNIWVVGNDEKCVVIDAPHEVDAILDVVAGRQVNGILLTHAHDDHCRVAPMLRDRTNAPVLLHPDDRPLWELVHPGLLWNVGLHGGHVLELAGTPLTVLHTPGHSPGAVCFYAPELGCVFTGDTLFNGGPGATGRSYSNAQQIEDSIRRELLTLPPSTVVHTGHGQNTTIGAEKAGMTSKQIWSLVTNRKPGDEVIA